jgi:glycosyltransferase involved in cell wall biosynthesis
LKPLISLVIPFYNTGRMIDAALGSALAQDYPNIEIILADDGSSDDTAERAIKILAAGARPWRLVAHAANRGVSAARNTGMSAASGEYVLFMDSDDIADEDFISTLYEAISRGGADISFCGYRSRETLSGRETPCPVRLDGARRYTAEELTLKRIFKEIDPAICTMMFRLGFLREGGLSFTEGCAAGEDVEFAIAAFAIASRVAFSAKLPYIYMRHGGMSSVAAASSREKILRRREDLAEAHFRLAAFLAERAVSPRAADAGRNLVLPEAYIKRLTLFAKRGDRARFDETLRSPEARAALKSSRKYFFKKPEVFLKASALLRFPGAYFTLRGRG